MEDRLKKFVTLIDAGTYTAAAKQLHTSQPALTTAVQKLSREIKFDLLVHGSRNLELTTAGHIAYEHGQRLVIAEKNLQSRLQSLGGQKQPLSLGCIDSVADALVRAELLPILEQDSEVSLSVLNSHDLLDKLKRSQLDIVIVAEQAEQIAATSQRFLGDEPFMLVCALEQLEMYTTAGKQGTLHDFLAYNQNSTTYKLVEAELRAQGIGFMPRLYSTNPSVLLELALQGRG